MKKRSTRHSKITGDFAEALVLYWLSKDGYECGRIDHTGIDLIASIPDGADRRGISVKSRSRVSGREKVQINLPASQFTKARKACRAFGCEPYFAFVVDGANIIQCFLVKLSHLQKLATGAGTYRYWQMNDDAVKRYRADPQIDRFEMSWGDAIRTRRRRRD